MNVRLPTSVVYALAFLFLCLLVSAFVYGVLVQRFQFFPYPLFAEVEEAVSVSLDKRPGALAWYYRRTDRTEAVIASSEFDDSRLNLMTFMGPDDTTTIGVIDRDGRMVNQVVVDWFEIWPEPTHIPPADWPKSRPGNHLHGAAMLPDGDVVFNFEQLGLVRVNPCGEVVWKLPYRTHHSVFVDAAGDLWVSGQITRQQKQPRFPNHKPPYREPTVLKVSPEGEILREISVLDVLVANDLYGFLHMATMSNKNTVVTGDTLHLNDVEVFLPHMEEGAFRHGDVMISLRNVSTVLVFDPDTLQIRYRTTGGFTRQHDPAFIDGNRFSVFDNNHIASVKHDQQSRILIFDATTGEREVWYEGSKEQPFYTNIMGKTQWLSDRNLLVTESRKGRAFQLNGDREVIWDYVNIVDQGIIGLVEEVHRLPAEMTALFSESQARRCPAH